MFRFIFNVLIEFRRHSNGVEMVLSSRVLRLCVRPSRYVCTVNKRLDLEAPICAHIVVFTSYVRLPIFIQILNVLYIHFYSQRLKSSISGLSHVNISQTVTDKHSYCQHRKSHVAFRLAYLHLTLAHSKGQGQGHIQFDYECPANGDN